MMRCLHTDDRRQFLSFAGSQVVRVLATYSVNAGSNPGHCFMPWRWTVKDFFQLRHTWWAWWCGPFKSFAVKHQVIVTSTYNSPCTQISQECRGSRPEYLCASKLCHNHNATQWTQEVRQTSWRLLLVFSPSWHASNRRAGNTKPVVCGQQGPVHCCLQL